MKKSILSLTLGVCLALSVSAQITIKSSDLPGSGDTLRYSTAGNNNLGDFQKTAANYTWNFSSLKPTGQEIEEYKPSLQTPYAFYFLGANKFGIKTADSVNLLIVTFYDLYDFYQNNSSAYSTEGRGLKYSGFPIASYYSDKDEIYQFPLDYGDRDSSTFRYKVDLATLASYSTSGYRINEVDGWGSITTPYGTFSCLRVKTTIVSNDTIKFSIVPIGMKNTTIQYKWLAKNEKFPILEIEGTETILGFTVNSVRYRDKWRRFYNPNAPVADFVASSVYASTIDTITFTNNTQKAGLLPSYLWSFTPQTVDFVNGTSNTDSEPEVVFEKAGTYDVRLHVENFMGKHDTLKKSYLTIVDAKLLAPHPDFIADKTTPAINETVVFSNQSTQSGNSIFEWSFFPDYASFVNGTDQYSENPEVKFTQGGYYHVTLNASNPYGTHDTTKMNYIYCSGTSSLGEYLEKDITIDYISGNFRVFSPIPIKTFRIYAPSGRLLFSTNNISHFPFLVPAGNLPSGVYFAECTAAGNTIIRKLAAIRK